MFFYGAGYDQFISGKRKSVILYHIIKNTRVRFGEFNTKIPGCAQEC